MSNEMTDGCFDLDTFFIDDKMYVKMEDVIGWLKLNQQHLNSDVLHDIIKALVRCKNNLQNEEKISDYLIRAYGFKKHYNYDSRAVDYDKYSCILRIHEIHFLLWSDDMKHFTLRVRHENPKGLPGGAGIQFHTDVMIPKVIYTVQEAMELINGMVNTDTLHLYNC